MKPSRKKRQECCSLRKKKEKVKKKNQCLTEKRKKNVVNQFFGPLSFAVEVFLLYRSRDRLVFAVSGKLESLFFASELVALLSRAGKNECEVKEEFRSRSRALLPLFFFFSRPRLSAFFDRGLVFLPSQAFVFVRLFLAAPGERHEQEEGGKGGCSGGESRSAGKRRGAGQGERGADLDLDLDGGRRQRRRSKRRRKRRGAKAITTTTTAATASCNASSTGSEGDETIDINAASAPRGRSGCLASACELAFSSDEIAPVARRPALPARALSSRNLPRSDPQNNKNARDRSEVVGGRARGAPPG